MPGKASRAFGVGAKGDAMSLIREMIAEAWADYRPWWVCYLVALALFLGLGVYSLAVAAS